MTDIYCPECDAQRYPEDIYCGLCGTKFEAPRHEPLLTQKELTIDDVRNKLGQVYYKMGKLEKALEVYEKALQTNPGDREALYMSEKIKKELFQITDD